MQAPSTLNVEVGWDIWLTAGTWNVEIMHTTSTNRGTASVRIDSTEVGTIAGYSASATRNVSSSVTGITVATSGKKRLSFKMTTAGTGGGYAFAIQQLVMRRTA